MANMANRAEAGKERYKEGMLVCKDAFFKHFSLAQTFMPTHHHLSLSLPPVSP
jgi:uridine phosphorylase